MALERQPNRVMATRVRKWSEWNPCSIVEAVCIQEQRIWRFVIESETPIELSGKEMKFLTILQDETETQVAPEPVATVDPEPVVEHIDSIDFTDGKTIEEVKEAVDAGFDKAKEEAAPIAPPVEVEEKPKKKKRGRPAKKK
jgi:hypothetical protein